MLVSSSIKWPRGARTRVIAVALALFSLFIPSRVPKADRAKLAIVSIVVVIFFLFAGRIWLPGGADQFLKYADAIVHGNTLRATIAQRDAGYPLLIVLAGYPFLRSLIPIILFQAAFAITLPLLIYEGLLRLSPSAAFWTGLVSILTLSPIYFMKMIHHDQTYIFFSMLMLCALSLFVQTKNIRFLYAFTIAAICASITRPAGNALFPLFLIIAYVAAHGNVRHYVACLVIFSLCLAGYAWHRYVIFDEGHLNSTPSYTGEQFFYNPYLNALDFKAKLTPEDIGPNFALAVHNLRDRLMPSPKESAFIEKDYLQKDTMPELVRQFAEQNILPFTTAQFIKRVLSDPNWEYYLLLCSANDDRIMLDAALEIARAHPGLIVKYTARNLFHFIFSPGYKHSRYNVQLFAREGLKFWPTFGEVSQPALVEMPPRAVREVKFDSFASLPKIIQNQLHWIERKWRQSYGIVVVALGGLMCVAWVTVLAGVVRSFILSNGKMNSTSESDSRRRALIASIIVASLVFGYNAVVTSVFADPDFRYRQMVDLQVILIAGLGLISIQQSASADVRGKLRSAGKIWRHGSTLPSELDIWQTLGAKELVLLTSCLALTGFSLWTLFMLEHTAS